MQDFEYQPLSDQQQTQLDRLVDGELSAEERRTLLRAFDQSPGDWRACALAFLEAQSLGQQLAAIKDEALAAPANVATLSVTDSVSRPASRKSWYAIAAMLMLAFGLGVFTPQAFDASPQAPDPSLMADSGGTSAETAVPTEAMPPVAIDSTEIPAPVVPADVAALPEIPRADNAEPGVGAEIPSPALVANADESLTFWVQDDQGQRQSLTAPLVDAAELENRFGWKFPSAVTPRTRQRFEGRGFQLSTRRRVAPLFLENGQPLVVPVEDVQLVPVKGTAL
ncbi:MAG: hypothetical protein AAGF31_11475 [Planctomycetota bacterium]